jgi:rSAM/selenodomain-associated transferase 1
MAKVPVAGEAKTRLCPPLAPEEAAALARCFLLDRLDQVRDVTTAEVIVAFAPREREPEMRSLVPAGVRLLPQAGADLGARMDRVLADLLAEGYAGAVAVGTDTPTLPTAYLQRAADTLLQGDADVVLGPAEDGGYYLIGLRQPAPALFTEMVWGSSTVASETLARVRRLGLSLTLLPEWFDVDRGEDLARLREPAGRDAFRPRRTLAFLDGLRLPASPL